MTWEKLSSILVAYMDIIHCSAIGKEKGNKVDGRYRYYSQLLDIGPCKSQTMTNIVILVGTLLLEPADEDFKKN